IRSGSTREAILDSAEALFARQGHDGTSMRQITSEAGVNLAAVNYHFGSKEALVQAVLKRRLAVLNHERLRLLDEREARAGGQPRPGQQELPAPARSHHDRPHRFHPRAGGRAICRGCRPLSIGAVARPARRTPGRGSLAVSIHAWRHVLRHRGYRSTAPVPGLEPERRSRSNPRPRTPAAPPDELPAWAPAGNAARVSGAIVPAAAEASLDGGHLHERLPARPVRRCGPDRGDAVATALAARTADPALVQC